VKQAELLGQFLFHREGRLGDALGRWIRGTKEFVNIPLSLPRSNGSQPDSRKVDLSMVFAWPCRRARRDCRPRAQPYLQLAWSWELHDGWGVSGMLTEFFRPSDPTSKRITETTFAVEKKLTEKFSLFTEYVGDYPEGAVPSQLWNSVGFIS